MEHVRGRQARLEMGDVSAYLLERKQQSRESEINSGKGEEGRNEI